MEQWKFINEFYEISSEGRLRRGNFILKKFSKDKRYISYTMTINNERIYKMAHRLVAEAFIPNPENKPCVNHIDFNTLNNNYWNLEWNTQAENIRHSRNNGRYPKKLAKRSDETKLKDKEAKKSIMVSVINDKGEIFDSIKAAETYYNISSANLNVALKRGWKCKGMVWNYYNKD